MNACAYVVGPGDGAGAALHALARKLGFDTVLPYGGIAEAERRAEEIPLSFFLFAEVPALRTLSAIAQAIRFSAGQRLRFSPLVYFCRTPSLEMIRSCIGMGFDDIITAPFTAQRVAGRLMRQVGTELAYFETSSYFGPDRRRQSDARPTAEEHRGGGQYRRLDIIRDIATGISVLRDDQQVML